MTFPVCPCDDHPPRPPVNLPQQSQISFRYGDYASFRRAVLTPVDGEQSLATWRTEGQGDLAVMLAEWFAYLGDILTFYDERIANETYLRTAGLDASVKRLIGLLGYRPRPAIGSGGVLAALVVPGQSAVLPKGLQIQSKPSPGKPPQTFELSADTPIGSPDRVSATTPPQLLSAIADFRYAYLSVGLEFVLPKALKRRFHAGRRFDASEFVLNFGSPTTADWGLLLQGAVTALEPGQTLTLRPRDAARGDPLLAEVIQADVQPAPAGGKQTAVSLAVTGAPPAPLSAAQATLERPNQTTSLWSLFGGAASGKTVHLASLARQIRPGAWVLFSGHAFPPFLVKVVSTSEAIWDATGSAAAPATPSDVTHPTAMPHTVLTLAAPPAHAWPADCGAITLAFDWVSAGQLLDQPAGPWSGTPSALVAASATRFPITAAAQVIIQDGSGAGFVTTASSAGDFNVQLGALPQPSPTLQPPFDVLYNPLPVTRGRTVSKEIVGSGDATRPGQSFSLAQSPVTYLQRGPGYASTIALTVDGEPWTEVASFFGQKADAQIFVARQDVAGQTHLDFGDGVNGARLPTGKNNVVATYRVGAGADSPPAGKLTVIAQSYPGLRAILNPVAVGGGADAEPAGQIRKYAPRSVLCFDRAVSVFDFEALAARAPGVSRARALWAWNNARQRTTVTVYVGDDAAAATAARAALSAAGDPNRPVTVIQAAEAGLTLTLTLIIRAGWDADLITGGVAAALTDPDRGLFCAELQGIGRPVFDSQIEAAILAVPGAVAITALQLTVGGADDAGPLHDPGAGGYFVLDPSDITLVTEADTHGG